MAWKDLRHTIYQQRRHFKEELSFSAPFFEPLKTKTQNLKKHFKEDIWYHFLPLLLRSLTLGKIISCCVKVFCFSPCHSAIISHVPHFFKKKKLQKWDFNLHMSSQHIFEIQMLFGNFRIFLVTSNLKVMRWMELLNFLFPPTLSTQTFWAIDQSFGKSIKQKKGRRGGGGGQ